MLAVLIKQIWKYQTIEQNRYIIGFVSKGINKARISYKGYGESQPKYSNKTREGRAKNRRIEMFLDNSK